MVMFSCGWESLKLQCATWQLIPVIEIPFEITGDPKDKTFEVGIDFYFLGFYINFGISTGMTKEKEKMLKAEWPKYVAQCNSKRKGG